MYGPCFKIHAEIRNLPVAGATFSSKSIPNTDFGSLVLFGGRNCTSATPGNRSAFSANFGLYLNFGMSKYEVV